VANPRLYLCYWGARCTFVTLVKNKVSCHGVNNVPYHLQSVSFLKGVREFENLENIPIKIVSEDLMESTHSTKLSKLITKGSHHPNICLVRITQKVLHQVPRSRVIIKQRVYSCVKEYQRQDTDCALGTTI